MGAAQASKIGELSDGVKSRLVFAMICMARPNMLLLDEPTNHLARHPFSWESGCKFR